MFSRVGCAGSAATRLPVAGSVHTAVVELEVLLSSAEGEDPLRSPAPRRMRDVRAAFHRSALATSSLGGESQQRVRAAYRPETNHRLTTGNQAVDPSNRVRFKQNVEGRRAISAGRGHGIDGRRLAS
jgi:hypothetical protein